MGYITKRYFILKNIFFVLLVALNIGPLIGTLIYSLVNGEFEPKTKVTLSVIFIFVLFITIINLISKWHLRTPMWVIIFILMYLLTNLQPILLIIGICTIVDELLVTPLYKHFREKYKWNKNYDIRVETDGKLKARTTEHATNTTST